MRWVGPGDVVVDVISLRGEDGRSQQWYRLRRYGRFVGNYRTLAELAKVIDVATLTEVDNT